MIIGLPETATFLVLPAEAIEILDWLSEGKSVGEAQALYQDRHGELPEMEEFLGALERDGFVRPDTVESESAAVARPEPVEPARVRFHFTGISQSFARRLMSPFVLAAGGVLIALALVAIAVDPSILPGKYALFFSGDQLPLILLMFFVNAFTLFLHEMAHLIAARAEGVSSRLGFGNRLWTLVAETDMSGIWGIARRQRYLPLLAGPLFDAISAALITLSLFAEVHGWVSLGPTTLKIVQATWLVYVLRLLWQCYFYVRTDFYYVIANFFGCKNLLGDTEALLWNQVARFTRRARTTDLSHISRQEMRAVRWYCVVWLAGRLMAFSVLALIQIPLLFRYVQSLVAHLSAGQSVNAQKLVGILVPLAIGAFPLGAGLLLWSRSLRTSKR